jgi:hypothetical protein
MFCFVLWMSDLPGKKACLWGELLEGHIFKNLKSFLLPKATK